MHVIKFCKASKSLYETDIKISKKPTSKSLQNQYQSLQNQYHQSLQKYTEKH